ncbi:MAG: penicillin-binding protein activator [Paracoccaceae bacterium]
MAGIEGIMESLAARLNGAIRGAVRGGPVAGAARAAGRATAVAALLAAAGCASSSGSGDGASAEAPAAPPAAEARPAEMDPSAPAPVAVLVPLGAADSAAAAAARDVADGARLAAEAAGARLVALEVRDTGGTSAGAERAARAALESGSGLILGPLFGANAEAVAAPAAARGVNLLTFSNTPSVAGGEAGNVWLAGVLAEDEAERILAHAARRGVRTVGVYHPDDAAGAVGRRAAEAAGRRLGLRIAPTLAYPRSFEGIQDSAEGYAEAHRAAGADAVLLPDGGQGLQAAAAFLNYHGLSTRDTPFLGLAAWDDPATPTENALVDGRFASLDPELTADFAARFEARYGRAPGPLAVLGHDAATAAAEMARRARAAGDTTPFDAEAITDPAGFRGAAGRIRFTQDGRNSRDLAVIRVVRDGFETVEPAATTAGPGA